MLKEYFLTRVLSAVNTGREWQKRQNLGHCDANDEMHDGLSKTAPAFLALLSGKFVLLHEATALKDSSKMWTSRNVTFDRIVFIKLSVDLVLEFTTWVPWNLAMTNRRFF